MTINNFISFVLSTDLCALNDFYLYFLKNKEAVLVAKETNKKELDDYTLATDVYKVSDGYVALTALQEIHSREGIFTLDFNVSVEEVIPKLHVEFIPRNS